MPKNENTIKLGREHRFLVDDIVSGKGMLSFTLSKPLKIGHTYDSENGVYKFVLHEVNSTDDDNFELGIADYYKYFSRDTESEVGEEEHYEAPDTTDIENPEDEDSSSGRKRWL